MILKILRNGLGQLIVIGNSIFKPKSINRTESDQKEMDELTNSLTLYQFHNCPFCVKVRRAMTRLNLNIELRNTNENLEYKTELLSGGGKSKVPCLRIKENNNISWLYESNDIISYLEKSVQQKYIETPTK